MAVQVRWEDARQLRYRELLGWNPDDPVGAAFSAYFRQPAQPVLVITREDGSTVVTGPED
jgi:hypothetical protein